jgi:hypothetical protein
MGFGAGWDKLTNDKPAGGGGGEYGPRRLWVSAKTTKRFLFLDEDPFVFYEHTMYPINKTMDKFTCPKKAGMGACPACEAEFWPRMVGYCSVVDMGEVTIDRQGKVTLTGYQSKNGTVYQFGVGLLGFSRGSEEKPGVLQRFHRKALQKCGGNLQYTVWDFHRSGDKAESCGDEFEFVEQLKNQAQAIEYLKRHGAPNDIQIAAVDRETYFAPKSYDALSRLIGGAKNVRTESSGNSWGGRNESRPSVSAGVKDEFSDDGVPF